MKAADPGSDWSRETRPYSWFQIYLNGGAAVASQISRLHWQRPKDRLMRACTCIHGFTHKFTEFANHIVMKIRHTSMGTYRSRCTRQPVMSCHMP